MEANQASSATVLEPRLENNEPEERVSSADLTVGLLPRTPYYAWKRLFDLAIGVPLAVIALPIVLTAALIVIASSGWPPLYGARRVGLNGREFSMWKLRTMVRDADKVLKDWQEQNSEFAEEYRSNFKIKNDPRITPFGRFLRRTSIDELPQLWSVIKGDMSLVGPRPYFESELNGNPGTYDVITRVRPGLTGPWQVQGRNALSPSARMFLDKTYVIEHSLGRDLILLLSTVKCLLKTDGR